MAEPVGFFSLYSRFTSKMYVTAVFSCAKTLSLQRLLKAITSFTIRGARREFNMQSEAVPAPCVRCVAYQLLSESRARLCLSLATLVLITTVSVRGRLQLKTSSETNRRGAPGRAPTSGCNLRARRRFIQPLS